MLTDNVWRILSIVDHDKQFELSLNKSQVSPIILNKFDLSNPDSISQLSELIFSDGSSGDFIAKCACGDVEGNNKIGMLCPNCHTKVDYTDLLDDDNLICKNWLSAPKELKGGWLHPKVYSSLSFWLAYGKNKRNYLDDILDIDYPTPSDIIDAIPGKGFQYLYDNFDYIMDYFANNHPEVSKKSDTKLFKVFLSQNRHKLFCSYIPVIPAAMTPIIIPDGSDRNKKPLTDKTADHIFKAAVSLSNLEFANKRKSKHAYIERTAYKAYKDIINYVDEATKKYLSVKKAIPRTHIFGARAHWTFRGVIKPIVSDHYYYELHVPWKMAVNTLRVHLRGILCSSYGLTTNEAAVKVANALNRYDDDINTIMNKLIELSPYPGLPCLWHRPPSIRDGSVMLKFWTKINTDLSDSSVGITPLDVKLPNADKSL